jgi:hypothetical protein
MRCKADDVGFQTRRTSMKTRPDRLVSNHSHCRAGPRLQREGFPAAAGQPEGRLSAFHAARSGGSRCPCRRSCFRTSTSASRRSRPSGSDPVAAGTALAALEGVVQNALARDRGLPETIQSVPAFEIRQHRRYNPAAVTSLNIVPGLFAARSKRLAHRQPPRAA